MESLTKKLKLSNEFLNSILESITSAIFIVDKDLKIMEFNNAFEVLFQKEEDQIIREYCGDAIGCGFTVLEDTSCGNTSYCAECIIRNSVNNAFSNNRSTIKAIVTRNFEINNLLIIKYFQVTVKPHLFDNIKYAILIFEDITDIETSRQKIIRQNNEIGVFNKKFKLKMEMAKKIQKNIIPNYIPPICGIDIAFDYNPIDEIGGDFYDVLRISNQKTGFFICDVSGHGLPAAMVTMSIKALIESNSGILEKPAHLIKKINEKMIDIFDEVYITLFYGVYDREKSSLEFVRCGHPYPILINNQGYASLRGTKNIIIGIDENIEIETEIISLNPGDKILLYTDGLIETEKLSGETFENELNTILLTSNNHNIKDLVKNISSKAVYYRENAGRNDDICILGFEIVK